MACVPLLQQRIGKHLAQWRRQAQCDMGADAVHCEPFENVQQRYVGLAYGFEQPVLFEEFGVFGMAHKGQMRMKNQSEETAFHWLPPHGLEGRRGSPGSLISPPGQLRFSVPPRKNRGVRCSGRM